MKKITAIVLILCLLLTAGCAGSNSGAVSSKEELDVREISMDSSAFTYAVETLDFPQNIWFSQSNIVSIENKLYLLGNFLESNYLYSTNSDGTEPKLLASCEDGSEQWYACCAMGGKLYVMDAINSQLIEFRPDGTRLRCIALPEEAEAGDLAGGTDTIFVLNDGKVSALKLSEGDSAELAYTIKAPTAVSIAQNPNGIVFVAWRDGETQAISTIDEENRAWGETRYLSSNCLIIGAGVEWDLYLRINAALYGYNFSTENIQKLLTFSDSGLLSNGVVYEAGDGNLIYTGTSGMDEASLPLLLEPVEITAEYVKLTMATLVSLSPWLLGNTVLPWNQAHPECQIEIKDYSAYTTGENPYGAQTQLMADIASGNIPDLYYMTDDYGEILNASLLARRKLLEDLYPYIDSDQELSRDNFFSGPLSALEINGGLYQMVPGFTLVTTMAAAQDVGAPESWTYEQLEHVVAESDYYQVLFDNFGYSRDDWLALVALSSGKKLVDWSAGQCYFDSAYFIHLLELAAAWAENVDTGGGYYEHVQNSHALLSMLSADHIHSAGNAPHIYGEGKYAFVGLPEIGGVLIPALSLGMSSQSSHKEQCWQFLREFLLQDSPHIPQIWGIPLRRDGAGQQLLDELERMKGDPIEHPGREQAMEDLIAALESTNALYQNDIQLWNIIKEETNKFYAGRATAEETAGAIQSRASIYLSEQQ